MSIEEVAASQGILRKDTYNLFWGKWPYSLRYPIPRQWAEQRAVRLSKFWASAKHVDAKEWRKLKPTVDRIHAEHRAKVSGLIETIIEANPHLADEEFSHLVNDPVGFTRSTITFYVMTEQSAITMLTNMPNQFNCVATPPSAKMLETMVAHAGEKVIIREKGWFAGDHRAPEDGYTYRVELRWSFPTKKEEVVHRVNNISFGDSLFSEGQNLILYLNSEDDWFLAKIALSEYMKNTTRCLITDK